MCRGVLSDMHQAPAGTRGHHHTNWYRGTWVPETTKSTEGSQAEPALCEAAAVPEYTAGTGTAVEQGGRGGQARSSQHVCSDQDEELKAGA